jgi:signal transduction histidine kinase
VIGARFTNDVVTGRLIDPASGTFVLLAVRDSGGGILLADQHKLFQKFVRLEAAQKAFPDAPGLGLYLARRLLACMGGLIWLESKGCTGEEGCTVYVAFPAYRKPRRTV